MRKFVAMASLTTLAACGGGGPQTVSSTAITGSGTSSGTHSFVNPTKAVTYSGIGGSQTYEYLTDARECCNQQGQTYAATSSTARDSKISIAYDPRDAVFTLTIDDPKSGAATNTRFQDPASRTNFGGAQQPQWGVSELQSANVAYLQAGDGNPRSPYDHSGTGVVNPGDNNTPPDGEPSSTYQATTFFYGKPGTANLAGTTTKYVTYAGYVRNDVSFSIAPLNGVDVAVNNWHLERGAFAYGERTDNSAVPVSGSASYEGAMLSTMVVNPTIDGNYGTELPTYYQWVEGTSKVDINFATKNVTFATQGQVSAPQIDRFTSPETSIISAGTVFSATGSGTIDLVRTGGFTGQIDSAGFSATNNGYPTQLNIAGSSLDGAFFGPNAEEVGGGFHVVGGNPDERIDIIGAFTGAKK